MALLGITTSVIGALKRGLAPMAGELGLHVCGGRGRHSRETPAELMAIANRTGLDGAGLAKASRLVAKVDSAAVQDGFDLYLHGFIVADDGKWVVVQQGMNGETRYARRYHWLSEDLKTFVETPHAAIDGINRGEIVNLTDRRASASRTARSTSCAPSAPTASSAKSPRSRAATRARAAARGAAAAASRHARAPRRAAEGRHPASPSRRARRGERCRAGRFRRSPARAGVGARTVESLAMVAEIVHGAPCRFADPARFSLAHGGKDRHPFPVATAVYDRTITVLRSAIEAAKLGNDERLDAIRRLDAQSRTLERTATGPSLPAYLEGERARSHDYGGRSVFGWEPPPETAARPAPVPAPDASGRATNRRLCYRTPRRTPFETTRHSRRIFCGHILRA